MKPKKLVLLAAAVMVSTQLAACGTEANEDSVIRLEAGHVLAEDSPYHMALTEWAEEVKEATDGRIQITGSSDRIFRRGGTKFPECEQMYEKGG